jgi:NTP pyrophosphatase (non-canonical NTP hydrolase)
MTNFEFAADQPLKGWRCKVCNSWIFTQRNDPSLTAKIVHEPNCTLEGVNRRDDMFKSEATLLDRDLTYTRAVLASSQDRQVVHFSEEVSELTIEISKRLRGRTTTNEGITEELADVIICVDLMRHMFGITPEQVNDMINIKMKKFDDQVCKALGLPDKPKVQS